MKGKKISKANFCNATFKKFHHQFSTSNRFDSVKLYAFLDLYQYLIKGNFPKIYVMKL